MDYLQLWRDQFAAAHGCVRKSHNYYDEPGKAESYDDSEPIRLDGEFRAASFQFTPETTVLDIGAGPGTLALPLARRVASVTAVEPSSGMWTLLQQHSREQGLRNIRVLPCRWEDADLEELGQHDVVIASYSLNMPDIGPALVRMDAAARKKVILYWFTGTASWEKLKQDLYPLVHGIEFTPQPKSDVLYGALCQMGFSPRVYPLTGTSFSYQYPNMEAAVRNLRQRLGLENGFGALLEEYIRKKYVPLAGGGWRFEDRTRYVRLEWDAGKRCIL